MDASHNPEQNQCLNHTCGFLNARLPKIQFEKTQYKRDKNQDNSKGIRRFRESVPMITPAFTGAQIICQKTSADWLFNPKPFPLEDIF